MKRRGKSRRPLQTLSNKHHILAALDACGAPTAVLISETGYSESYISSLRASPLYRLQIEKIRDNILVQTTDAAARLLDHETLATVQRIVSLRDNEDGETPHPVQLGAANSIMDRTLPKRHTVDISAVNKITFDHDTTSMILNAMREIGFSPSTIEAEAEDVTDIDVEEDSQSSRSDLHEIVGFKTVSESMAEKLAEEQD